MYLARIDIHLNDDGTLTANLGGTTITRTDLQALLLEVAEELKDDLKELNETR